MSGTVPPLPQYAFMAWWLVKHRDNFTFTLSILILPSHSLLCLPSSLLPWGFVTIILHAYLVSPCVPRAPPIQPFNYPNISVPEVQIMKLIIM
jgi:hypothetical protein